MLDLAGVLLGSDGIHAELLGEEIGDEGVALIDGDRFGASRLGQLTWPSSATVTSPSSRRMRMARLTLALV